MIRLLFIIQLLSTHVVTSYAFQAHKFRHTKKYSGLFLSSKLQEPEWRNDDYLDSLSGTQEQREDETQRYHEQVEKIRATKGRMKEWKNQQEIDQPQPPKIATKMRYMEDRGTPVESTSLKRPGSLSGGTRFQEMMERSKKLKDSLKKPHGFLEQMYNLDIEDELLS